jgi:hypothetical protein
MWDWQPIYTGRDDFIFQVDDFVSTRRDNEKDAGLADFIEGVLENWPAWFQVNNTLKITYTLIVVKHC